jgi:hypothetical protein
MKARIVFEMRSSSGHYAAQGRVPRMLVILGVWLSFLFCLGLSFGLLRMLYT